ncbi:DNA-binding response regulator [Caldalkalibacillus thermarum]|uniref:response regulator transcription factor n=1 Tax=Caldalkalibacillus thermarum TaxID=296745 RepID=UPI001664263E|nr:response regulator transcription factor [Caldalkalibacillus thermarum]GGK28675.1 DNA-binding response regulator [Caldalkalibacillus thermarum]
MRILVVDDHKVVAEETKAIINQEPGLTADAVTSSQDAKQLIHTGAYDIYLLDLQMPGVNGMELTREIKKIHPEAKVLILTGHEISPHFNYLVEAGVSGFISKTASRQQLIRAIRCAIDDEVVLPLSLLPQLRRTEIKPTQKNMGEIRLTQKEEEILVKIAQGKSNRAIADELLVSQRSIERHLTEMFRKMNVNSRAELIVKARELGLLPEAII